MIERERFRNTGRQRERDRQTDGYNEICIRERESKKRRQKDRKTVNDSGRWKNFLDKKRQI